MDDAALTNDPLLGRLIKVKKEEAVHSSGYAQAGRGERIGSTSAESFAARQAMDQNRKVIQKYKESEVVSQAYNNSGDKAQTYEQKMEMATEAALHAARGENGGSILDGAKRKFSNQHIPKIERDAPNHKGMSAKEVYAAKREELSDKYGAPPGGQMAQPPARRNPGISR